MTDSRREVVERVTQHLQLLDWTRTPVGFFSDVLKIIHSQFDEPAAPQESLREFINSQQPMDTDMAKAARQASADVIRNAPAQETETPRTDAAELDALILDMPGQQTTDKVVRSRAEITSLREKRDFEPTLYEVAQMLNEALCGFLDDEQPWKDAEAATKAFIKWEDENLSAAPSAGAEKEGKA